MKVKELIEKLEKLPQEDIICVTSMNDYFFEEDFDVRSSHDDECQEIIINRYFK